MTQGESLRHFDLNSFIEGNVRGAIGSKRKITSSSGLLSRRSGRSSVENLFIRVHEEDSSVSTSPSITDLVSERKLVLFSYTLCYPDIACTTQG